MLPPLSEAYAIQSLHFFCSFCNFSSIFQTFWRTRNKEVPLLLHW